MLKKGVRLKKTDGPVPQEKKLEELKKPNDIFSVSGIVSDVAKTRAKRLNTKKKEGGGFRKSIMVDNLLNDLEKTN